MLQIEKEHKRTTLMTAKKKDLVGQIMYLEHNNNALNETINQQAENFKKLCKECVLKTDDVSEEVRENICKEYAEDLLEEFQQIERFEGKITLKDVMDVLQLNS